MREGSDLRWEEGFAALLQYQAAFGNVLVPQAYVTPDGYRLGLWVRLQRDRGRLSLERRHRLDEIGLFFR